MDSEPLYVAAEARLFAQFGINVPDEDWKYFKGTTEADFYQLIQERYGIKTDFEKLVQDGRRYIRAEFQNGLNYIPGFSAFRNKIAGHCHSALVTSTSAEFLEWVFANTNVQNCFDLTITADDVRYSKPHPEPYRIAMERLGVLPAETMIIEDSINGLKAAVASGAKTVGFLSSLKSTELPRADFYAGNYTEINAIFDYLTGL